MLKLTGAFLPLCCKCLKYSECLLLNEEESLALGVGKMSGLLWRWEEGGAKQTLVFHEELSTLCFSYKCSKMWIPQCCL